MKKRAFLLASLMLFGMLSYTDQAAAANVDQSAKFYDSIDDLFDNASKLEGEAIVDSVEGMESDYSGLNGLSDTDEIKNALKEYEDAKADYISGAASKCSYGDTILAEWKKQKSLTESMIPSGSKLKNFESVVSVTDVVDNGDKKSINIYEWNALSFKYSDDSSVESSGYGFNYTAVVKKNKIKAVTGTEANYEEGNENSESEACVYADVVSSTNSAEDTEITFTYSSSEASAYAQEHALNYNADYRSFPRHDCANFVSQCLYKGGLPMNSKWNYYGYSDYTTSWSCAGGLMNYLSRNIGKLVDNCSAADISVGDPVFYWTGTRWGHVGICTKVDSHGNPQVCAHTNDRLNVEWDMYERCRVIQIPSEKKAENTEESNKESSSGKLNAKYNDQITFQGSAKITPKTFGGITVTYKNKEYKVSKIKVDTENQRFQITKLKKASDKADKAVKKATKGKNGLTYNVAAYKVTDEDKVKVKYKNEKKKKLKSVKVKIAGEWYEADKSEYSYDNSTKVIAFNGTNLVGSYSLKK